MVGQSWQDCHKIEIINCELLGFVLLGFDWTFFEFVFVCLIQWCSGLTPGELGRLHGNAGNGTQMSHVQGRCLIHHAIIQHCFIIMPFTFLSSYFNDILAYEQMVLDLSEIPWQSVHVVCFRGWHGTSSSKTCRLLWMMLWRWPRRTCCLTRKSTLWGSSTCWTENRSQFPLSSLCLLVS